MAAPIVSWYSRDNKKPLNNWNIGTVDAGTVSNEFGFLIWNNRGNSVSQGRTPVSTMTDCVITVRDSAGGLSGNELVKGQWVEVKVDTMKEHEFSKLGSTEKPVVGREGSPSPESNFLPVEHPIQCDAKAFAKKCSEITVDLEESHGPKKTLDPESFPSPIGGFINDGTKENSLANFCEVTLRVNVPEMASAGPIDFLTRVRYSYV